MKTIEKYLGRVNRFEYRKDEDREFYIVSFELPLISINNTPAEFHLNNILIECEAQYFELLYDEYDTMTTAVNTVIDEIEKKANELLSYRIKSLEEAKELLNS